MNLSVSWVLILLGLICWALVVVKVPIDIDLWVLGWIFVVAGALLVDRH